MASIIQIGARWRAQVRRRNHKPQTRTFDSRAEAAKWARGVEARIDAGLAPKETTRLTLGEILREYRRLREEGGREIAPESNTHYMLAHLEQDLGAERVPDLTPERLLRWAKARRDEGAGGYTINMELSALGTALRHAASFMGVPLPDVTGAARPLLLHMQLIAGGNRRTRKPTDDELQAVLAWVQARDPAAADAMRVAAVTGLRRSELVTKLRWDSLDEVNRAALIRQRKHPRRQLARDELVPMLGDAWGIVQRQPRIGERVFQTLTPEKLTDTFTAATRALGVPDLRLHDLRHLAATNMQERGLTDTEAAAVLGHRSTKMTGTYTHFAPAHLHAKFSGAAQPAKPTRRRAKAAA